MLRVTRRRSAFTIVELLVTIAIIGILVALLVPAVQYAREAGRRITCKNNLKQLVIGVQHYHENQKVFPSQATWGARGPAPQNAYHHTWLKMILPYLEQVNLSESFDDKIPAFAQGKPISVRLHMLLCPSDNYFDSTAQTHDLALTNYAASEGYHWWPEAKLNQAWWRDLPGFETWPVGQGGPDNPDIPVDYSGVFPPGRTVSISDIRDGTENTIMIGEVTTTGFKNGRIWSSGTGAQRTATNESVFRAAFVALGAYGYCCELGLFNEVDNSGVKEPGFFLRNPFGYAPTYVSAYGPNTEWPGASSLHNQRLHVAYAGGHVDEVDEGIEYPVWAMLHGATDNMQILNPKLYPPVLGRDYPPIDTAAPKPPEDIVLLPQNPGNTTP